MVTTSLVQLGHPATSINWTIRTLPDVAVLDLLQHLWPHRGVHLLVLLVILGLELDNLGEPPARVANPGLGRGQWFGVRDVLGGGDRCGFGPQGAHGVGLSGQGSQGCMERRARRRRKGEAAASKQATAGLDAKKTKTEEEGKEDNNTTERN